MPYLYLSFLATRLWVAKQYSLPRGCRMTGAVKPLGPAIEGHFRYGRFEASVKSEFRYVWSEEIHEFLKLVRASCHKREEKIPASQPFYRARLGVERKDQLVTEGDKFYFEKLIPYEADKMKPIENWNGEGRANPRGIACLYMATTPQTAFAEVRPWIGAEVSVARIEAARELTIIDCARTRKLGATAGMFTDPAATEEDGIWYAIDLAFATPVSKEEESRNYIPTQILAELFKSAKYDGIKYKSLLREDGYNIALFNLDDANVKKRDAYRCEVLYHLKSGQDLSSDFQCEA